MMAADASVLTECIAPGQLRPERGAVCPSCQKSAALRFPVSGDTTGDLLQVLKQRELRLVSCQESIRNPPLSLFDAKLQSLA